MSTATGRDRWGFHIPDMGYREAGGYSWRQALCCILKRSNRLKDRDYSNWLRQEVAGGNIRMTRNSEEVYLEDGITRPMFEDVPEEPAAMPAASARGPGMVQGELF